MARRKRSQAWIRRDLPLGALLFVCAVVVLSAIIYFMPRPTIQRAPEVASQADSGELYTGSIIVVPLHGDQCSQRIFDNRSGAMWDNGYGDCDELVSQLKQQKENNATGSTRWRTIGNAFRHQN